MAQVDLVLGNREKLVAENYAHSGVHVGDVMVPEKRDTPVVSGRGQTRCFVEIQTGCDHRCTFCIIPYGRGDSASVPSSAVVAAIARAVDEGQQEVVLTGVDLTSYRPSLAALVSQILAEVPALPRLRLSSLDPAEMDEALFDLIAQEPRIMPHVHLSLQSGDPMILKRMKRRHTRTQAIALVERLKTVRADVAIGADLIAGFPTESEAMHRNNVSILAACDIVFGHVFPYSPRAGTPAARMPLVDTQVAKARARELREVSAKRRSARAREADSLHWTQTVQCGVRRVRAMQCSS
jgi:threonylcarbamoyladenosine tRNA methylthiotransferase MtaB